MALLTKAEVLAMYERESVGDVRRLALSYLELLNQAPDQFAVQAEREATKRELDELRITVANRAADTQHDALVDRVADLEAKLADLDGGDPPAETVDPEPEEKPKPRRKPAAGKATAKKATAKK